MNSASRVRDFADLTAIAAKIPLLLYHGICHDSWLYLGICTDVRNIAASQLDRSLTNLSLRTTLFTLPNGGTAGAIWIFFIAAFCFYFVMLSMAEMASM